MPVFSVRLFLLLHKAGVRINNEITDIHISLIENKYFFIYNKNIHVSLYTRLLVNSETWSLFALTNYSFIIIKLDIFLVIQN